MNGNIAIIQAVQSHVSSECFREFKSVGVRLLHLVWLHILQMLHRIQDVTYLSKIEQLGLLESLNCYRAS